MKLSRWLTGVAVVALMAAPALAQTSSAPQQQTPPPLAASETQQQDMEFATKAAGDGQAEVELGKLALQQAGSAAVRRFGQRMVDDHTRAGDELAALAQAKGIELPEALPDEAQQLYDELQQQQGQAFDQAYMDAMVEDHRKAIDLFEQQARSGADAELTSFAEATLPTLQEHLDLARQTREQAVAAAGEGDQPAASAAMAGAGAGSADQQQAVAPTAGQAVQASEVIGTDVVNEQGDEVGEIEDLVIDANQVEYAVVSVGGFLGIGDKQVAIPLDRLKLGMDKSYLMSDDTAAELEQMPAYQKERYQPRS